MRWNEKYLRTSKLGEIAALENKMWLSDNDERQKKAHDDFNRFCYLMKERVLIYQERDVSYYVILNKLLWSYFIFLLNSQLDFYLREVKDVPIHIFLSI